MEYRLIHYPAEPAEPYIFKAVMRIGFATVAGMLILVSFGTLSMNWVGLTTALLSGYTLYSGSDKLYAWLEYQKELEEFRDIVMLRRVTKSELRWIADHTPDCLVYGLIYNDKWVHENHVMVRHTENHVKFRNKTDEMLFTIAMGQTYRYIYGEPND